MLLNLKKLGRSFYYAFRGLGLAWREGQIFRFGLVLCLISVILMVYYKITTGEKVILILMITSGIVLELLNTVVERMSNVLSAKFNPYIQMIKDLMAGTVLVGFIGWILVNIIIFSPYIYKQISG
ncbi:MAG: diacylglycerol kinase [bacterium]|nr:diacylglycerol kinase [bacterium]